MRYLIKHKKVSTNSTTTPNQLSLMSGTVVTKAGEGLPEADYGIFFADDLSDVMAAISLLSKQYHHKKYFQALPLVLQHQM